MQDDPQGTDTDARRAFARMQIANALVWAATILGVAVAAKGSDNFIYELLVLLVGCSLSFGIINTLSDAAYHPTPLDPTALADRHRSQP